VLIVALLSFLAKLTFADNNFTYTGTTVAGQPFTIAWDLGTYATLDIFLYQLTGFPYCVPTTSQPIARM
jgi:hypothetical protein